MRGGVITTTMVDHVIAVKNKSQPTRQTLARKVGQNGNFILESSIPAPFNGRVEMKAANSTLVIHNLQYNDSVYEFVSSIRVNIDSGGGNILSTFNLRPEFTVTIHGITQNSRYFNIDIKYLLNLTFSIRKNRSYLLTFNMYISTLTFNSLLSSRKSYFIYACLFCANDIAFWLGVWKLR